jgi:hypothetical protein
MLRLGGAISTGVKRGIAVSESRFRAIYSLRSPRTCIRGAGCLSCTIRGNQIGFRNQRLGQTSLGGMQGRCGLRRDGFAASSESDPGGVLGAHPKPRFGNIGEDLR